jgi:hypothetical protein
VSFYETLRTQIGLFNYVSYPLVITMAPSKAFR